MLSSRSENALLKIYIFANTDGNSPYRAQVVDESARTSTRLGLRGSIPKPAVDRVAERLGCGDTVRLIFSRPPYDVEILTWNSPDFGYVSTEYRALDESERSNFLLALQEALKRPAGT
jgi:hypothetical protein